LGLILIVVSLLREPILKVPSMSAAFLPLISISSVPIIISGYFAIYLVYRIKATKGLEKQLKKAATGFIFLFLAHVVDLTYIFIKPETAFLQSILSEFGAVWMVKSIIYLIGLLTLFSWMWGYIRFRPAPQLFVVILSSTLGIFLATTVFFSYLLLTNIENDTFAKLKTDIKLFQYSLERLQEESITKAKSIATNGDVITALNESDTDSLEEITIPLMEDQKTDSLILADYDGLIIYKAEDQLRSSGSLKDDPLFESAVLGNPLTTITGESSALSPVIFASSAVPIENKYVVKTSFAIDNAFVDGVKDVTDLDVTLFAGDTRSATTFTSNDGLRFIGSKISNDKVKDEVLNNSQVATTRINLFGKNYYAAYAPLVTLNDKVVGMISVAKPQSELFEVLRKSISLTFAGSAILMLLTTPVIYMVSKFIREQQEA